jgi:hypothetical protein
VSWGVSALAFAGRDEATARATLHDAVSLTREVGSLARD